MKAAARAPLQPMRAIDVLQADGSRRRFSEGRGVLREMRAHGQRQQGPSPAHVALSKAFIDAFVPQWPELAGPGGGTWRIGDVLTFAEFRHALRSVNDKACGRDGLQLGFLLMLPVELLEQYWRLLVACAQGASFPAAWSTVVE